MEKIVFEPTTLKRISNLKIAAKMVVDGFLSGFHKSSFKGFNVEFSEHRPYMSGDEIKNIDWKLWAKTDKLHVKRYEEETSLKATILLDISNSMNYGESFSKLDYSRYLAASLSYLMLKQQDSVGLAYFSDSLIKYVPPRSGIKHIKHIIEHLDNITECGNTDFETSFKDLIFRFKRRGMLIVISDLFDDADQVIKSLKLLKHKKHEIIVIHVMDNDELNFPFKGDTKFVDLESNEEILVTPKSIKINYNEFLKTFMNEYKKAFTEAGIDYFPVNTNTPFELALTKYVAGRERS
jgi:uncharacterized protein (DUF58 family)